MHNRHWLRNTSSTLTALAVLVASNPSLLTASPQIGSAGKKTSQATGATKPNGVVFVSDDKSFSITMPQAPHKQKIDLATPFGPVVCTLYTALDKDAAYIAGYMDYPSDKIAQSSPDKLLAMSANALRQKYGKGVVKDEKITYHGFHGRALVCLVDVPSKMQIDQRYFPVKNRMYMFNLVHTRGTDMTEQTARYLNSFKVLK